MNCTRFGQIVIDSWRTSRHELKKCSYSYIFVIITSFLTKSLNLKTYVYTQRFLTNFVVLSFSYKVYRYVDFIPVLSKIKCLRVHITWRFFFQLLIYLNSFSNNRRAFLSYLTVNIKPTLNIQYFVPTENVFIRLFPYTTNIVKLIGNITINFRNFDVHIVWGNT